MAVLYTGPVPPYSPRWRSCRLDSMCRGSSPISTDAELADSGRRGVLFPRQRRFTPAVETGVGSDFDKDPVPPLAVYDVRAECPRIFITVYGNHCVLWYVRINSARFFVMTSMKALPFSAVATVGSPATPVVPGSNTGQK